MSLLLNELSIKIFTDTNRFFVSFGPRQQAVDGTQLPTPPVVRNLTLDERAVRYPSLCYRYID
jgi:hypothetical protein